MNPIPNKYRICDSRNCKELGANTFSGIKRLNALNILEEAIDKSLLEKACEIAVDLHCSNSLDHLWTRIFTVVMPKINIDCPNLPYYLLKKHEEYEQVVSCYKKCDLIQMRNNQQVRNLLIDVISTLVLAKKNTRLSNNALPKLADKEFQSENMKRHVVSANLNVIKNFTFKNDSSEIILAMNEIANNLREPDKNSLNNCYYWINWLLKLEKHNKVGKQMFPLACVERDIKNVPTKYCKDWVWIIWTIILKYTKHLGNKKLVNQIKALYGIYKLDCQKTYSIGKRNQKFHIIYQAFLYIICEGEIHYSIPVTLKSKLSYKLQMVCNVNSIYKRLNLRYSKNKPIQEVIGYRPAYEDPTEFLEEPEKTDEDPNFAIDRRQFITNPFQDFNQMEDFTEFEELEQLIQKERGQMKEKKEKECQKFVEEKQKEIQEPINTKVNVDVGYRKKSKVEKEEEQRKQMEERTRYLDYIPTTKHHMKHQVYMGDTDDSGDENKRVKSIKVV